jgi:hypothetical protein
VAYQTHSKVTIPLRCYIYTEGVAIKKRGHGGGGFSSVFSCWLSLCCPVPTCWPPHLDTYPTLCDIACLLGWAACKVYADYNGLRACLYPLSSLAMHLVVDIHSCLLSYLSLSWAFVLSPFCYGISKSGFY